MPGPTIAYLATAVAVSLFAFAATMFMLPGGTVRQKAARLAYAGMACAFAAVFAVATLLLAGLLGALSPGVPSWLVYLALLACAVLGVVKARGLSQSGSRPRIGYEQLVSWIFGFCAAVAVLVTVGIVYAVLEESFRFFLAVPVLDFLFGLEWSPQIAIRADQEGSSGRFGIIPLLSGTLLISVIAMFVAVPLGLLSAIYQAEFASRRMRGLVKPVLEFLAGIPTVVYGFFALVILGPALRDLGNFAGFAISSESALAAGAVIGVMTIPFVASLSEDALHAVPDELRYGSMAMGATKGETAIKVTIPAALPGIAAGFLLAFSRAVGETMIVVMAAGLAANLTANPFESVTTVTTQIVTLLIGDQEFDDPKTLAAFALGLALFAITLALNVTGLRTVRKYHQSYD